MWCFSSAFPEQGAFEDFDALFRPTINLPPGAQPPVRRWKAEIDPDDDEEHFALNFKSMPFEPVDTPYNLQDLHDVISSAALNDLDLDSRLANRQSDFEMVCVHVPCAPRNHPLTARFLAFGTGITPSSSV